MRVFSACSGIGGFELGIQNAYRGLYRRSQTDTQTSDENRGMSFQCSEENGFKERQPSCDFENNFSEGALFIGYSEINKYADIIYKKHFGGTNHGDITKIIPGELPDFDCFVAGFPCQSFSIAGKRKGFDDIRGTIFFDIARILQEKKPDLVLLENVKGLLSHDNGRTFKTIIATLAELGYCVEWQVLNSKHFGVPQSRERIYIACYTPGYFGGESGPKVFPIGTANRVSIRQLNRGVRQRKRVYGIDGVSPTLDTMGGGNLEPKIAVPVLTPGRLVKRQNGRRFKNDGEPFFTITSQDVNGVYDGSFIRKITPLECERLQGFPDGWTESLSDTQRYKCLGNAVTVNVVEHIFRKIIKMASNRQVV